MHRKAVKNAHNSALGPQKLPTAEKLIAKDSVVGTAEHCYSLVHYYQSQLNLVGPVTVPRCEDHHGRSSHSTLAYA